MSTKVEAKQSNVKSYGKGLFAKILIKKGSVIAEFKGRLRNPDQKCTSNRSNVKFVDNYVLECDSNNLASFANDAIDFPQTRRQLMATLKSDQPFYNKHPGTDINAAIKTNAKRHKAYLIAETDIDPGTEIFCHYGFPFWFQTELRQGFLQEEEIELGGYPDDIFKYESFAAYIRTFYPNSVKFEVKPYGDYYDLIIDLTDGTKVLFPLENYFKQLERVHI